MVYTRRIFLIFAICLVLFGTNKFFVDAAKKSSDKPIEVSKEAATTASSGATASAQLFRVTRVIDGDTIEIEGGQRVRYIGIDTPETVSPQKPVQCFGVEASDANKKLVEGNMVRIQKDVSETDRYGRLLRYVYMDDIFINDYLVRFGFAHASTFPPDVTYASQFVAAQKEARENNRGLWRGCDSIENSTNTPIPTNGISENKETPTFSSPAGGCTIKGNISAGGEKIYHVLGCESYDKTVIDELAGERWFCTEHDAVTAGWRKAKNCP